MQDILAVVANDTKRRFSLADEEGVIYMRANQGHSISCVKEEQLLSPILSPDDVPVCIHGTYEQALHRIMEEGLNRMSRNTIQMAAGLPNDPSIISGVRPNVGVLIYIDVGRSISLGIPFFRSHNKVICSPGPIPPSCFAHVARRSDGASLLKPSFLEHKVGCCSAVASTTYDSSREDFVHEGSEATNHVPGFSQSS